MLGAFIGAGGSLLGGLFGSRSERRAIAAQNAYNDPSAVRARFEAAGFNPLLGIQPGVGMQSTVGGTNFFGAAIADAALQVGSNVTARADAARASALATQNQRLTDQVKNLTIRPKVGGIYARRETVPALPGGPYVLRSQGSGAALRGQDRLAFGRDAVAPEVSNTYKTFGNDGQITHVPLGPDLDEVISGSVIAANNKAKSYRVNHTFGTPLSMSDGIEMPPGYVPRYSDKASALRAFRAAFTPQRSLPVRPKKPSFWDSYRPGGF